MSTSPVSSPEDAAVTRPADQRDDFFGACVRLADAFAETLEAALPRLPQMRLSQDAVTVFRDALSGLRDALAEVSGSAGPDGGPILPFAAVRVAGERLRVAESEAAALVRGAEEDAARLRVQAVQTVVRRALEGEEELARLRTGQQAELARLRHQLSVVTAEAAQWLGRLAADLDGQRERMATLVRRMNEVGADPSG